jgi:feruloyl esterase
MWKAFPVLLIVLGFEAFVSAEPMPVAELLALELPDVRITEAAPVEATDTGAAHVKVEGVIGKAIRFELLLPDEWNGRFAMGGGGGLVGSVQNGIRGSVNQGYATAGTDTGHEGKGTDGSWALDDLEALVNFGHAAVHRTAEVSKAIIREYYGRDAEKSYFVGCSRGGGQAMMAAQRYPEDFDGIVAGAPAFNWNGFAAMGIKFAQTLYPDPDTLSQTLLTREDLDHLYAEVMKQADAQDGLKDGIIQHPPAADFDLDQVPGLSDAQRAAIRVLYEGVGNADGPIYPGFPIGAEGGDGGWYEWQVGPIPDLVNLGFAFSTNIFKYFVFQNPDWDYATYDFDTFKRDTRAAASVLNATDPNLDPFAARGGKLLLWHGWSDAALPATETVKYYESVLARDANAPDYARLFMIPGCYHCGSGPGISTVDWLQEIVAWVEQGEAPDSIIAKRPGKEGAPEMTRPLYPWPDYAKYDGDGDPASAENFEAVAAE